MTRDERLLVSLFAGDASTAVLAQATGLTERTCRYGLTHLVKTGHVWSPQRGRWRLTESGRAVAASLDRPSASNTAAPGPAESRDLRAAGPSAPALRPSSVLAVEERTAQDQPPQPADPGPSLPAWLAWGSAVVVIGLLAFSHRTVQTPAPVVPQPAPGPTGSPYAA